MYNIAFFAIDLFEKLGIGNEQAVAVSSAFLYFLGRGRGALVKFFVSFFWFGGVMVIFFPR